MANARCLTIRSIMRLALPLLLPGTGVSAAAAAQDSREPPLWMRDRSFSFFWENDAFGGVSDSSYTNGVRFAWDFSVFTPRLASVARIATLGWLIDAIPGVKMHQRGRACLPFEGRAARPCGTVGFGVQQTIYTPSNILDTLPQPNERPFVGLLFASALLNTLDTLPGSWQASSEFVIGVIGPWSQGESAQSLAHWTWSPNSAKPRGWRNQLRNSLQVGLINNYSYRPRWLEYCRDVKCNGIYDEGRTVDFTPRAELVMTTYMRRASIGGVARVGNRFPDVLSLSRIPTTAARGTQQATQFWFAFFGSADLRRVGYSAFLVGTSEDEGNGGWRDIRRISSEPNVIETAYGVMFGARAATFAIQIVQRSQEYTPGGGSHRFGALTFSLFSPRQAGG